MPTEPRRSPAADLDALFADNLIATRRKFGMSRRALSEASGIPARVIDRPRRHISIGEAVVLAGALGVKPADLLKPMAVEP